MYASAGSRLSEEGMPSRSGVYFLQYWQRQIRPLRFSVQEARWWALWYPPSHSSRARTPSRACQEARCQRSKGGNPRVHFLCHPSDSCEILHEPWSGSSLPVPHSLLHYVFQVRFHTVFLCFTILWLIFKDVSSCLDRILSLFRTWANSYSPLHHFFPLFSIFSPCIIPILYILTTNILASSILFWLRIAVSSYRFVLSRPSSTLLPLSQWFSVKFLRARLSVYYMKYCFRSQSHWFLLDWKRFYANWRSSSSQRCVAKCHPGRFSHCKSVGEERQ